MVTSSFARSEMPPWGGGGEVSRVRDVADEQAEATT